MAGLLRKIDVDFLPRARENCCRELGDGVDGRAFVSAEVVAA